MDPRPIIIAITFLFFLPLAGVLLYVWYKFGKGNRKVQLARIIFLVGSLVIVGYMLTL
jgi:hypothetical protein